MSSTQHRCVFVGNIPYDATEEQLIQICEEVGPVVSFRLVLDRDTGKPKGYGFCEFRDEETALSARRNLQGYEINGRQLRVDFAENEKGSVDRNREQGRGGPGLTQNIDAHKQTSGQRAARDPSFDQPIGLAAAASAATVMAGALGASQMSTMMSQGNLGSNGQPNGGGVGGTAVGNDALTNHLAGMSRHQLYEIVSQMKDLIQQNSQQARQILIANPQLTKALFQAQIMLGMVRPPQMVPAVQQLPLQSVTTPPHSQIQAPQQQPAQQPQMQMQPVQPPQMQSMPQIQTMPQTSVQQGQMQQPPMSAGQMQPQMPGVQQSQAQNIPLQSQMQALQPSQFQHSVQTTPMQLPSQPPPLSMGMQPQNPSNQQAQPQPLPMQQANLPPQHLQPPPLPQQPRPLVPQSQLQPQTAQSMGFQLLSGPQPPLPQPPFQQPGGMAQTSMGLQYQQQMQPPLPNQPPPQQVFQMPRSGADMGGGPGIGQGGLPSSVGLLTGAGLGGPSQVGRGPTMGGPSGPVPHMAWNQPLPSSGTMGGVPHSTASIGMPGHMGPGHSLGGVSVGMGAPLAGGLSGNGAPSIQQDGNVKGFGGIRSNVGNEGPSLIHSQGYNQVVQPPPQPQQQSQQQPQMQASLELEQQKALLQQVMNLTPEQINSLPPEQRQQVLQLQQAFRG